MYWSSMRSPVYGHVSISSQWAIIRSTLNRLNHQNIMWVKSPCLSFLLQFLTVVEWCSKALLPTDCWLVVWNMNFSFPHIGNSHPKWRSYFFQRGRYTTNQILLGMITLLGESLSPPTFGFFMTRHESEFRSHCSVHYNRFICNPFKWEICIYI